MILENKSPNKTRFDSPLLRATFPMFGASKRTKATKSSLERGGLRGFFHGGRGVLISLLMLLVFPPMGLAQQLSDTEPRLQQYLIQAAENNPELKSHYHQYLAALEQVPQVTTLPDPELSFGYFINPIETRVGPQQARFGITQMFPWFGTLESRGNVTTEKAKARFETFREARNRLFLEVQNKWYQLYRMQESIRIVEENVSILETFESLAMRRYESGQVGQVDVLRAQIEKEDLKTQLELLKDDLQVGRQEFNELLNREDHQPVLLAKSLQPKTLTLTSEELEQKILQQNPSLIRFEYERSSARSAIEVARKEGLPSFGMGIDYIITGERDMALTDNGQDAMMVRAGIQLPLYRKKYRAKKQQARLELQATQNRHEAVQNRLVTQLEQAKRDYYDAERRMKLYRDIQIQRTQQALNILTEQYASADTDFEELLRLQRKLLDYELARETALVDLNKAVAQIEYLYGKYNINPEELTDN